MLLVVLLNLYKEQSLLDTEARRKRVNRVIYSLLELLLTIRHILSSRFKV